MQRFNCFTLIHKALRAMLYDTALTIQQTYFADVEVAETAIEKIENILRNFDHHAHNEDHYVLPAVQRYNAQLVDEFEKEHVKDLDLGNNLQQLLHMYKSLSNSEERIACGSAINKSYVEFMVFNLEHMAKEEQLIMPVLWQHYTDVQLMAFNESIIAKTPPHEMQEVATWMLRGINNKDAINWLKGAKATAPDFVFASLLAIAEREWNAGRFTTIIDQVMGARIEA
jgi:hemerythrin-like domain-containing protein